MSKLPADKNRNHRYLISGAPLKNRFLKHRFLQHRLLKHRFFDTKHRLTKTSIV